MDKHLPHPEIEGEAKDITVTKTKEQGLAPVLGAGGEEEPIEDGILVERVEAELEREPPVEKIRHDWRHSRLIVTGPAAYAAVLDRDRDKVDRIDLLVTTREQISDLVSDVGAIEDLSNVMGQDEYDSFVSWIAEQGYRGKIIVLRREMESWVPSTEPVRGGVKLQLWHEPDLPLAKDDLILSSYYYNSTKLPLLERDLERGPVAPERLEPNGTLAMALETMELGERFGLEYDDSALRNADKMTKNASLELRTIDMLDENGFLTPAFIEQFGRPEVANLVGRKYQRLGQLAEAIARSGGVIPYIEQEFGDVYLDDERMNKQRVKLYDVKLIGSPASRQEQLEFLQLWRGTPDGFETAGEVKRWPEQTELALPEGMDELVDQGSLNEAVRSRAERKNALDAITGTYEVSVAGNELQARSKADAYLKIMGLPPLDKFQKEGESIGRTLIRAGIHPQNPILSQLSLKGPHEPRLVISNRPEDILQASYKKSWTSCIDLEGGEYANGLYEDIANGAVVAYLVQDGKYLARAIIRSGTTLDDTLESAAAIETVYGDERYQRVMGEALEVVMARADIKCRVPMVTLPYSDNGVYFDLATGRAASGARYYYGPDDNDDDYLA